MPRRPMMAGNWKMNKTVPEAQEYTAGLLPRAADAEGWTWPSSSRSPACTRSPGWPRTRR
jgi:hypothetical protein